MNKDFTCILAAGCSFVAGSNIMDENKKHIGMQFIFSKLVSDYYKVPHYNIAEPGSGNERILLSIHDWIKKNPDKKPLILIGLSGISRITYPVAGWDGTFDRNNLKDLHIFDYESSKDSEGYKTAVAKRLAGEDVDVEEFAKWNRFTAEYMFDLKYEQMKLNRNIEMTVGYFDSKDIPYIIFNSVEDNLYTSTKENINYYSFPKVEGVEYRHERADMMNYSASLEDDWTHYLRSEFVKENGTGDLPELRSGVPPYGKWLCGGHPSPYANELLAKDLIKIIGDVKLI